MRSVDTIQSEDWDTPMVSVAPASAHRAKGVGEVSSQNIGGAIGGGSVEVTRNEGGSIRKRSVFVEKGEGEFEFVATIDTVLAMLFPARGAPESEIGGGRLEVKINKLYQVAIGETGGDVLGAVLRL